MTTQTLQNYLSKLNQAPAVNNVYVAFDDSSSVTPAQYSQIKISLKMFLNLIFSLKTNFFKTSLIKYDDAPIDIFLDQVQFGANETKINNLVQKNGAVNFVNGMVRIETLSAQVQGNKVLFLFTNGTAVDQNKIQELLARGFEIFCFLVLENGTARKTQLDAIFGNGKVILLPNLQTAEDCFRNFVITSADIPNITVKNLGLSTATLTITGIDNYKEAKFVIKNFRNGELINTTNQAMENSKEITLQLNPENPKYKITVQGCKANQISQVSKELELTLNKKIHPITKKLRNPNLLKDLRGRVSQTRVPECLKTVGIQTYNVSLIGEMGNGKSSSIDTIWTAMHETLDRIYFPAAIGKNESTLTKGLKKYLLTNSLQLFDFAGMQTNDNSNAEIDNLAYGRLLHNFQQGGKLNEENKSFKNCMNLNGAAHVFIYVLDIQTALNDDHIRRFGEISRLLKQNHGVQVLVCLTKLDQLQENSTTVLDESDFGEIMENGVVKRFIQDFAERAAISVHDIFPILNYTGPGEERSQVKDILALNLLDEAIHAINTYFTKYHVVRIVDQNQRNQGCFLLENPELYLEQFYSDYRAKISHSGFKMGGFYKNETLISEDQWKTLLLNNIKFDQEINDGFQIWTLKLHNDLATAAPIPKD
jgi:hypothetical protein